MKSFRVAYVVTHPIQYQAPLLRALANCGAIDLEVFFLSDFSLRAHYEQAFQRTFKWDTDLTEGYRWQVLPRRCIGASTTLERWLPLAGLRKRLRAGQFDALWVHGWAHIGLCQAIEAACANRIPILFRGESTPHGDSNLRSRARGWFYQNWLLPRIDACLYIGARNREFYRQQGVEADRLFAMPYAVDNDFFQRACAEAEPRREALRGKLGLTPGRPIVLFAGKLIAVKAPDELLAAFTSIAKRFANDSAPYLLFAGDGPLRPSLEAAAQSLGDAVRFLGFRNQTELPALYDLCDVLVLPSRFEPWGLVVNEAMNAARPIVVSDHVGAGVDLVENGVNGYLYPSGDAESLAAAMTRILESAELRERMSRASLKRISPWNFTADRAGLLAALNQVTQANYRQAKMAGV
jgi:glycosyltransferase involved in cell wall biosynthesis